MPSAGVRTVGGAYEAGELSVWFADPASALRSRAEAPSTGRFVVSTYQTAICTLYMYRAHRHRIRSPHVGAWICQMALVNRRAQGHCNAMVPTGARVVPAIAHRTSRILRRPGWHERIPQSNPVSPLQDEVDERLLEIITAADAIGGGRRLYFHFSGHGASSPDESGEDVALLLAKWSRSLARLALSTDEYRGALGGMGLFEEIMISLDCCRITAERAVGLPPTITHRPQTQRCATRTFIAYATEPGRSAFEVPDHELWQGVFTRCLLTILRRSPQGISAADLKRTLEYEVASNGQQAHIINGLREGSRFGHRGMLPKLVITFRHVEHAHMG